MDLELTRIFVKVVQNGSFSRAAEILKLPKSTVSKAVSRLERETGTRLMVRTTRSLTPTAAGRAFFEATLAPIHQIEDAQKSLYGQDSRLTGLVRITAPEDLGSAVIAPAIAGLSVRYPDLSFELEYTDRVVDLVKDGFDLAVRLGRISESSFKVKRLGEVVLVLVAAPSYLKANPKIRHPGDLKEHLCLSLSVQAVRGPWLLKSSKGSSRVDVRPRLTSNLMSSLLKMASGGAGVALVPGFLCQPQIATGELVRVLPDWASPGIAASLLSPVAASSSARLKVTSDHLIDAVSAALRFK